MSDTVGRIRRLLLAIVALGLVGTAAELVLLEHYQDSGQLIPLVFIVVALAVMGGHLVRGGAGSILLLRTVMAFLVLSGAFGIVLHYRANMASQLELDPAQSGWILFGHVMRTVSPPTLAPGVMVQWGLLGLLYTYRHPDARWPPLDA